MRCTDRKISYIIPVYNVEDYLEECVDSILGQAGDDVEVLLIDDGSTDRSGMICDQYKEKYANVVVMHQENRGHSAARNAGLDRASGEYIAFVDSDDYIAPGSIDCIRAYIASGGSDICFMNAYKFYPDGSKVDLGDAIECAQIRGKSKAEVMQHLSTRPKYPGSACTKIFRREFLIQKGIRFPVSLLHSEDLSLSMDALLAAETFDSLEIPYYYYRQNRQGSVSSQINETTFLSLSSFVQRYAERLKGKHAQIDSGVASCAMAFVAYEYAILLWTYDRIQKADKKEMLAVLKEYQWVMRYGRTGKLRVIHLLCSVLGAACTSRVIAEYMNQRNGTA